jgi:hypothetical protein
MRFSYRTAPSNVQAIIISTCKEIWNKLSPTKLTQLTEDEWKKKAEEFYSLCKFCNCTGATDGKHIAIQALLNILQYKHCLTYCNTSTA